MFKMNAILDFKSVVSSLNIVELMYQIIKSRQVKEV